ncbi:MAG: exodeoxyribonuclease VII large subunit [Saprospiraceae bacterium]|nr:exodeoxyribonuclease VII large subunit [Saprospiraceae bacterium]
MQSFTLAELNRYITRVIALNFPDPIWVKAEILQVKESRGHNYLELIQKEDDGQQIAAQAQAVLWNKTHAQILKNLQLPDLSSYLQAGTEVSLLVDVQHHSIYGLKLSVQNIDPSYTLGKLELIRQQTMAKIKGEGLTTLNASIQVPAILQRIAIISSAQASGYQDFIQQLDSNKYGYYFHCQLFSSALQGAKVSQEMTEALAKITQQSNAYDCVVIIRGGGSRLDLSSFDQYEVAAAVARMPLPVFTGIGHETDTTVTDVVSHRAFKTPTAVAAFILERNRAFEQSLIDLRIKIVSGLQHTLMAHQRRLDASKQAIRHAGAQSMQTASAYLEQVYWKVTQQIQVSLSSAAMSLERQSEKLKLLNPTSIFDRGYSLTLCNGSIIKDARDLSKGDDISTKYAQGSSQSTVTQTETT